MALMHNHPVVFWGGVYAAFSNLVSSMPDPDATSGKGYIWLYRLLHIAASDIARVAKSRGIPVAPDAVPVAVVDGSAPNATHSVQSEAKDTSGPAAQLGRKDFWR